MKHTLLFVIGSALSVSAFAQASSQSAMVNEPASSTPVFVVNVTSRTVEAINYRYRDGAADVALAGTALMPSADGKVKVRSKRGTMEVEAEFGNLQSPTTFGGEYLTYVLWAISPDGRAANLGEVLVGGNDRSKLTATTDLQTFALIVTAEPYFAVRQPSDVVVLENVVGPDTKGTAEAVSAKYELMERGGYIPTGYKFDPVVLDAGLPLEFLEARNALRIAKSEGAANLRGRKLSACFPIDGRCQCERHGWAFGQEAADCNVARDRADSEDAREIAVKRIEENQQRARTPGFRGCTGTVTGASRICDPAKGSLNPMLQTPKLLQQTPRPTRQSPGSRGKAQAAAAKAQTDMATNQAASAAAVTAAQADADQSRIIAKQAQQNEQQADAEKATMRAQLSEQLSKILETRDSARGLIVSMSDVLFDTGEYSLKAGAKEKLAKVAGILIAYPSLNIAVGGYTDNVGGDQMNQTAVREPGRRGARLHGATGCGCEFCHRRGIWQYFTGSLER